MENIKQEESEENKNKILNFYWNPILEIREFLEFFCKQNNYKNILEIGPGIVPFPLSTMSVGYNEKINNFIEIDIDDTRLPYADKSIDFVYSRHVLEDIQNPNFAMNEIIRVSNSGYIETPSPLIEITKGVDNTPLTMNYSGYIHHRYIIWSNIKKCEIYFLPKYNSIIDTYLKYNDENLHFNIINNFPIYWNNYFIWKDKTPKIIMYKNGINFNQSGRTIIQDYINLVIQALYASIENTNYFLEKYNMNNIGKIALHIN